MVAKTLWRSLLRVAREDGEGDGEERIERSMIGREENDVVMLVIGILVVGLYSRSKAEKEGERRVCDCYI